MLSFFSGVRDQAEEDGVTRYANDATQGCACALSCPAATVFRNYFVNGKGQAEGGALDCLSDVAKVLNNDERGFWVMKHGFCMPAQRGSIARASKQVQYSEKFKEPGTLTMAEDIAQHLRVGVHWDTEVFASSITLYI